MDLKLFSFFSGAGFLDLGFEKEGYKILLANEFNEDFLNVYKFARENMKILSPKYGYYCGSIDDFLFSKSSWLKKTFEAEKENSLIGFIGGPPCPDFSVAGKNEGISGSNGKLTESYKNLILKHKPDFFVFENVKGLWTTKKHRNEYERIKRDFSQNGYVLIDKLVNALEYGVPQDRERLILIGIKYVKISRNKEIAQAILRDRFNWRIKYSIEQINLCNWPVSTAFVEDGEYKKPDNIIEDITIQYWFNENDVNNHFNKDDYFLPRSLERFNTIEEGDVSKKSFKRLHRWRYSPTAAYGNNEVHLHPYKPRRISVAEALAIQSMPKEFIVPKSLTKSDMFKTIGNGVPYLLAINIAKNLKKFLTEL